MLYTKLEHLPPSLLNCHKFSFQGFQRRGGPGPSPLPQGSPFWFLIALLARNFWIQSLHLWESWARSKETWPGAWGLSNNFGCVTHFGQVISFFWSSFFFLICSMGIIMPNLLNCYGDINCQALGLAHSTCSERRGAEWCKGRVRSATRPDCVALNPTPYLSTVWHQARCLTPMPWFPCQ